MGLCGGRLRNQASRLAIALWLGLPVAAHAQVAPPTPPAAAPGEAEGTASPSAAPVGTRVDVAPAPDAAAADIVVTGSRLGNSGFSAPTPVTVVGGDLLASRASANVADTLNELPAFRNTSSPTQSQRNFNTGVNAVDLRGLGTSRTLVLIDGQRFTPTVSNGTFDSGMVPASLVKRVDIVTGGASAAYGSDAVAGAVNFVLDTRLTGVRASAQYGITSRGDRAQPLGSLAAGTAFAGDRGHLVIGGEWANSKGVGTIYERPWGRRLPGLIAYGTARAAGLPAQAFATGVTYSQQTSGGLITAGPLAGTAFGPGGTPYAFQYGTVYSSLMVGGANPGANPFGNWPIETPNERRAALAQLSFEPVPDLQLYVQGNYGYTRGSNFTSFNQTAFTISVNNPFLPDAIRQQMVARGLATINVGRLLTETGGLRQDNHRRTLRGIAGVKGKLFGAFDWDVNYQRGETRSRATIFQNVLAGNYRAAVNAVAGASGPVCGPLATNPNLSAAQIAQVQAGCVPINIFGNGSPSAAAIDYITEDSFTNLRLKRDVATANLRGSPFSTWAGPVQIAIGAEHRRDSVRVAVDDLSAATAFASGNNLGYAGSVRVTEEFAEIGVPLAKDAPLLHSLDLNGAFRHTDYSTSGAVNTWKVGATYEPVPALRLRVTRSRDIRAPNLQELYARSGRGVSVASGTNALNGRTGAINSSVEGNLDLKAEIADTLTGGIVVQPDWSWGRGLRLSVDAYRIKVNKVITSVSAQEVINRCAAGATTYCAQIQFDSSTFGIFNVVTTPRNLAQLETSGLDVEVSYLVPLQALSAAIPGRLQLRALGTRVFRLATTDSTGTIDRAGTLQGNGVPATTLSFNANYAVAGFALNLNARHISGSRFDATLVGPGDAGYSPTLSNSIADNRFPAATYFNLQLSQEIKAAAGGARLQVFAGVDNLFDKQPPQYAAIGISSGGDPYDLVGRRFTVGARVAF